MEGGFWVVKKAYIVVAQTLSAKLQKKKTPWISKESWDLIDRKEVIVNKKIFSTSSERVTRHLRTEYVRKDKKVKRSIKADETKCLDNIAGEA